MVLTGASMDLRAKLHLANDGGMALRWSGPAEWTAKAQHAPGQFAPAAVKAMNKLFVGTRRTMMIRGSFEAHGS